MEGKRILVVGTGTIGWPVIQLMKRFADANVLGVRCEEIMFAKAHPFPENVKRINNLLKLGLTGVPLQFVVPDGSRAAFRQAKYYPTYEMSEAIKRADVVLDVTEEGPKNKTLYYDAWKGSKKVFIAQGSAGKSGNNFGPMYIHGINDEAICRRLRDGEQFFVQGSCNGHTIARVLSKLILTAVCFEIHPQDFWVYLEILRRSDEPNKKKQRTAFGCEAPNPKYIHRGGTYHIDNVVSVFASIDKRLPKVWGRVAQLADPYMHALQWRARFSKILPEQELIKKFIQMVKEDMFCAVTDYCTANEVHEYAKGNSDHRLPQHLIHESCFSHAVFSLPTMLAVNTTDGETLLDFTTYTPQDRNVVVGTLELAYAALDPHGFDRAGFRERVAPLFEPKEF